eukprot:m.338291 g.338291  ORF g.338291 m.338291 type:complete len:67 (-) comp18373_c0_seq1:102-302(-)
MARRETRESMQERVYKWAEFYVGDERTSKDSLSSTRTDSAQSESSITSSGSNRRVLFDTKVRVKFI